MRVILVPDTHLSPSAPEAKANCDVVLRYFSARTRLAQTRCSPGSPCGHGTYPDCRSTRSQRLCA